MTTIIFEEQAGRMAEISGCKYEEAMEYLEAQDEYYDLVGINVYPDGNLQESDLCSDIVVDGDKMEQYITEHSSLSNEMVEALAEAELRYLEEKGLIEVFEASNI